MEQMLFAPDIELEHNERALVAQTTATPGYKIINRIMRSEVDKFIVDLINAPEEDDKAIIAKHKLSKAAAQFYQAVVDRVNSEVHMYMAAVQNGVAPVDVTAGMLDLGEPASTLEDFVQEVEMGESLLEEESI